VSETTSATAPATSSVTHRTLRAIILPFAFVGRFGIAGLPFLILGAILWRSGLFHGFTGPVSLVTMTVPALQEFGRQTEWMSGKVGMVWFSSLLTFAFWLCAWQRATATQFREPLGVWLTASLRCMPQYLIAFGAWAITGFVVFALANALYSQNLWLSGFPLRPNGMPEPRAPLAIVIALLASLYVYVRFAPLTALVAGDRHGSLQDAFRITAGKAGLRLYLATVLLLVLSWALCVASRNASTWIAGTDWIGYAFWFTRILALLTQVWLATFAALTAAPKGDA
jgi:hypothetical protein